MKIEYKSKNHGRLKQIMLVLELDSGPDSPAWVSDALFVLENEGMKALMDRLHAMELPSEEETMDRRIQRDTEKIVCDAVRGATRKITSLLLRSRVDGSTFDVDVLAPVAIPDVIDEIACKWPDRVRVVGSDVETSTITIEILEVHDD